MVLGQVEVPKSQLFAVERRKVKIKNSEKEGQGFVRMSVTFHQ